MTPAIACSRTVLFALLIALGLAWPPADASAQLAKRGGFSGKFAFFDDNATVVPIQDKQLMYHAVGQGPFINDAGNGFLHMAVVVCPGRGFIDNGRVEFSGYCSATAAHRSLDQAAARRAHPGVAHAAGTDRAAGRAHPAPALHRHRDHAVLTSPHLRNVATGRIRPNCDDYEGLSSTPSGQWRFRNPDVGIAEGRQSALRTANLCDPSGAVRRICHWFYGYCEKVRPLAS